MNPRTHMLRMMLLAIGVAALVSIAGVILPADSELRPKLFWSSAVFVIAAAIALKPAAMISSAKSRSFAILLLAMLVVEMLLAFFGIWCPPTIYTGNIAYSSGEELYRRAVTSMAFIALLAGPLGGLILLRRQPDGRAAGNVGFVTTGISTLLCMVAVWWPELRAYGVDDRNQLALTFAASLLLSVMLTLASIGRGWRDRPWRFAGMLAAGAATGVWLFSVWVASAPSFASVIQAAELPRSSGVIITSLYAVAGTICIANVLDRAPLKGVQRLTVVATIALIAGIAVLASFIAQGVDEGLETFSDMLLPITSGVAIAAGAAALGVVVMMAINRKPDYERTAREFLTLGLTCPRCNKPQSLPVGDAACQHCGLRIHTRIQEPRCPHCDYLLFELKSDKCPECGGDLAKPETSAEVSPAPAPAAI